MELKMCAGLLALSLAACGGGGGGATSTASAAGSAGSSSGASGSVGAGTGGATGSTDVVLQAGSLQSETSTSTYAAGSLTKSAFDALNVARTAAGAGVLVQSAALDVAADAHAQYLTANLAAVGLSHLEEASRTAFYATTVAERIAKAGFSASYTTEDLGGTGASMLGSDCALGLLNTVYHGISLLSQATHVGWGFGVDTIGMPMCVANLAAASTNAYGQVAGTGSFIAYPNGGSAVDGTFYVGYESPRPSAALLPNLSAGTPVLVNVRNADFVNFQAAGTLNATVTAFNLKDAGGNLIPAVILAHSTLTGAAGVALNADSNLPAGAVVLVPQSPLAAGQSYTVTFAATLKVGSTPLAKTWTFATKS